MQICICNSLPGSRIECRKRWYSCSSTVAARSSERSAGVAARIVSDCITAELYRDTLHGLLCRPSPLLARSCAFARVESPPTTRLRFVRFMTQRGPRRVCIRAGLFLAELIDQCRPQGPRLVVVVGIGSLHGGLRHYELGDWINANILALVSDKCELTPITGK
jgi:hypothetical protein